MTRRTPLHEAAHRVVKAWDAEADRRIASPGADDLFSDELIDAVSDLRELSKQIDAGREACDRLADAVEVMRAP